jgi:hypothetical protein
MINNEYMPKTGNEKHMYHFCPLRFHLYDIGSHDDVHIPEQNGQQPQVSRTSSQAVVNWDPAGLQFPSVGIHFQLQVLWDGRLRMVVGLVWISEVE